MVSQSLYSVEQVADLLDLHVKTVRGYVRDGRLKAVRIGKQYRIAREDLEAFTGRAVLAPAGEGARRQRHVEVSSIVQIDAIGPEEMGRLSTLLMAATAARPPGDAPMRIETVYAEERASMKIILVGGLATSAELLKSVDMFVRGRS